MMTRDHLAPKGMTFSRFAKAIAGARGEWHGAIAIAQGQGWSDTPEVVWALKAAVSAMSTSDMLEAMSPVSFDLAEYLRPLTIIGRLAGFRRVPFDTRLVLQDGGTSAAFVGEGQPIPVSAASFGAGIVLRKAKAVGLAVITQELLRLSTPSAETAIGSDLARAVGQAMDFAFIDQTNAGVTDERPASVTFGAPSVASTGNTIVAIDSDLKALYQLMVDADVPLSAGAWIMSPQTALYLALQRGTGGAPAYPGITLRGGTLLGLPVVTSSSVARTGDPATTFITLIDTAEILLADDGQAEISLSNQTSLQMSDTPDGGAVNQVSMFQTNTTALRGIRYVNFMKRRPESAVVLTGVGY